MKACRPYVWILKIWPSHTQQESFFLTMHNYTDLLFFGTAEIESGMPSSYSSVNVSHNVLKIPQKFFFISHFFVATTFLIPNLVDRETSKKIVRSSLRQ